MAVGSEAFVQSVRLAVRKSLDALPCPVVGRIKAAPNGPREHGTVEVQTEIVMVGGGDWMRSHWSGWAGHGLEDKIAYLQWFCTT